MFCSKCGSTVNEGEKFCSVCGQKVETAPMQQPAAQPSAAQPYGQQQYGQQQYGQQPYGNMYSNAPKKSKKGLVITLTLVAVLAIAAVVLFLWPGYLTTGAGSMQMRFLSDNAQVFTDAFSGMSSKDDEKKANMPFEMTMKMDMDISEYSSQQLDMDMAYDEEALGISLEAEDTQVKALLLDDVLYIDTYGQTMGIKFSSDEDLSKPMPLKDRMTAIFKGVVEDLGGDMPDTEVDWTKLLMMMVNSIDEENFRQTGSKTVLTLDADAIIETMKTFRDSLSKDEKLLGDLESFIKDISGQRTDVLEEIDNAIENLEDTKGDADFELTWTLSYEGGRPVSIDLAVDSPYESYEISFGYENTKNGKDITLVMDSPSDYSDLEYDISYEVNGDTLDFTFTADIYGQTSEMNGTVTRGQDKDTAEGEMTMDSGGQYVSVTYDATIEYGMPSTEVKEDERFKVDTDGASITKVSDLFGMVGSGMFGYMMPGM